MTTTTIRDAWLLGGCHALCTCHIYTTGGCPIHRPFSLEPPAWFVLEPVTIEPEVYEGITIDVLPCKEVSL